MKKLFICTLLFLACNSVPVEKEKEPFMHIWFGCQYEVVDITYEQMDSTTWRLTVWTAADVNHTYEYHLGELPPAFFEANR